MAIICEDCGKENVVGCDFCGQQLKPKEESKMSCFKPKTREEIAESVSGIIQYERRKEMEKQKEETFVSMCIEAHICTKCGYTLISKKKKNFFQYFFGGFKTEYTCKHCGFSHVV